MKAAVTDDRGFAIVQIQHRREAEIHTAGPQLRTQHIARSRGGIHCTHGAAAFAVFFALAAAHAVVHPHLAKGAHGRDMREAIGAKALHAAALVVHADQQVGLDGLDIGTQLDQRAAVLPVALEENDAAHQRMGQARAVHISQRCAGNINDQRCMHAHDLKISIAASAYISSTRG